MPEQCEHDWEWEGDHLNENDDHWSCQICGEKDFHSEPPDPDADEYLVDGREFYPW